MQTRYVFGAILALAIMSMSWARTLPDADTVETETQNINGRIVGGSVVDIALHPHQVSMRLKSILVPTNSYSHNCGGSIYSPSIIITAAHCLVSRVASQYQIIAGTNERRSNDGVVVPVKELIIHENYNPSTYNNDIGIVVLATPLPINNYTIKPVELAEGEILNGATSTVTGWGTTTESGTASDLLQEVKVPIVSNELCNQDYGAGRITDAMLCAGVRGVGGKDACQGDSGGPLLVNGKLAGIVSWGSGCARAGYPGVYANVPNLLPWLRETIAQVEATLL